MQRLGELIAFLKAILPASGQFCATTIRNKRAKNRFFDNVETLAEFIIAEDDCCETEGGAVYHACASYDNSGKRKQENVVAVKALWLDVDCGPDKSYQTVSEGLSSLRSFLKTANLPKPFVVSSGSGLHVYWLLNREVSRDEWQLLAIRLKRRCSDANFYADPSRTCDAASILRPVGTFNRKAGRSRVVSGSIPDAANPAIFAAAMPEGEQFKNDGLSRGQAQRNHLLRLNPVSVSLSQPEQVNFNELADKCAQLGRFRDLQGCIPEPQWFAGICVLGHCVDGDAVAHEWSKGFSGYTYEETQGRLDRSRKLSGPTTCEHYHGLDAGLCESCPVFKQAITPFDAVRLSSPNDQILQPDQSGIAAPLYTNWDYYQYRKEGLWLSYEKADGERVNKQICKYPVYLSGVHKGELRHDKRHYHFEAWSPNPGWHPVEVGASKIFGQNARGILADAGVIIYDWPVFDKFVQQSVDRLKEYQPEGKLYEQFGWKDDRAFLWGNRLYGPDGVTTVAVDSEVRVRSQWLCPRPDGSLAGWKDASNKLFQGGTESISFSILASFAAPLMRFMEDEEGGAILSLVTRASGTGKTTTLAGGRTIWSWHERGLAYTSRDTLNAKGLAMGVIGNLPIFYDEFSERDPELVRNAVMDFTNGRDRLRATSEGEIKHQLRSWNTFLITASNRSLVAVLRSGDQSEAPAMRVLEFDVQSAEGMITSTAATMLKRQLEANGGWAGDAYLRFLVQSETLAWARNMLPIVAEQIEVKGGFSKKHRYRVRALAVVWVAARIVQKLELVDFSPDRVMNWACKHFAHEAAVEKVLLPKQEMIAQLARFIDARVGQTVIVPGPWRPQTPKLGLVKPMQQILVRREQEPHRYIIPEKDFREHLLKSDIPWREFEREMSKAGILKFVGRQLSLGAGTDYPGGQRICFAIDGDHPDFAGGLRVVESEGLNQKDDRAAG